MPGRVQLAAAEPEGLLTISTAAIDEFLCQALRGEDASWGALGMDEPSADFCERSRHHGVQALLYQQVRARPEWTGWPGAVRDVLEKSHKAVLAQDMMRQHFLRALIDSLSQRDIRCLLMKGEALAATHYEVPGTRPRGDADLFISVADVPAVVQAIGNVGFEITTPVYKAHQFTVVRSREKSETVAFDIHWRILNHPRYARVLSFEEAYARSSAMESLESVRALHVQDALLVACLHRLASEKNDPDRLIWLYDIHRLVSAMPESDLIQFADRAVVFGVQDSCRDGLLRAQECFRTQIPSAALDLLTAVPVSERRMGRLHESHLGLLLDDWMELPNYRSRSALLRELFLPPVASLRRKYSATDSVPRPALYARHILTGLIDRLRLR